jgi:beta-glucosidase
MKNLRFTVFILFLFLFGMVKSQVISVSPEHIQRAKEIVSKMSLDEKLDYIGGYKDFFIRAIPRLGLPEIRMADGPQGLRNDTKSTLYPSGILSSSTWNRNLIEQLGEGLGRDARARGVSFLLGPGVNIYRAPMCGRNFEYFGEDPYLTGEVAKCYIIGVQSKGVIATIKHFAANNEEWDRHAVSSDVDERTLNEIYLPSFRKAVMEAGVGAVMNSYNMLNGVHATENNWLNIDVLRNAWGFKGTLMSDWKSVYSGVGAANGGLDLEMPVGKYMNKKMLLPAIKNGIVAETTIDLKVQHILQTLIAFGLLDHPAEDSSTVEDNPMSCKTAYDLACEGMVLLKNEGNVLPLKGDFVVMGPNATTVPTGGGSGFVTPFSSVTPWQGLKAVYGSKAHLISDDMWSVPVASGFYADSSFSKVGFKAEFFNNKDLEGTPSFTRIDSAINYNWGNNAPAEGINKDNFSVRWTAFYKATKNVSLKFCMEGDDGYRIFVNGKELLGDWGNHAITARENVLKVEEGKQYNIVIEYYDNAKTAKAKFAMYLLNTSNLKKYVSKVKNVVLCVGFNSTLESEGSDRTFALPSSQIDLINDVALWNKNIIVVLNAGGGVDFMPWKDKVKAILMAWYPGQEGGKALASILSGKVAPSGKLPISIERKWEDNPTFNSYYLEKDAPQRRVQYAEGVFVGYRGYDRNEVKPLFPFGFGLSYTSFAYSNLDIKKMEKDKVRVEFDVTNTGGKAGAEVAQVYVGEVNPIVPRPTKELKGFDKVYLKKGETKHLSIELNADAFSYYNVNKHSFVIHNGEFNIMVGSSSAHLPLEKIVTMCN